ncbi:MAG: DUF6932 family protein [Janthinobacterium lividum]
MPLPIFREDGWLPGGHHTADWTEIVVRFGGEPESRRRIILASLLKWRDAARTQKMAGLIILDGSFIPSRENPGDFDLIFSYDTATEALLQEEPQARALSDYQMCHALGFLGDIFALPESLKQLSPKLSGMDMFDFDRHGTPKGVIEVIL